MHALKPIDNANHSQHSARGNGNFTPSEMNARSDDSVIMRKEGSCACGGGCPGCAEEAADSARNSSEAILGGQLEDDLHKPMLEQHREKHGEPPGGIDPETGVRVGPSDAEIKYGGPKTPGQAPTPRCLPKLRSPMWDVVPKPMLQSIGGKCNLHLMKNFSPTGSAFGVNGMEFLGNVEYPSGCTGKVYFVQYARPQRSLAGCLDKKEMGMCTNPGWGLDGSWPYKFGNSVDITNTPSPAAMKTIDIPGQLNISNPSIGWVRICMNDEFVTYLVYEDPSGALTSLGWMHWGFTARAIRGTGACPPTHTTADCAGWTLTGTGTKISENFAPGAAGPQPLSKTTASVNLMPNDCAPTECPLNPPAKPGGS